MTGLLYMPQPNPIYRNQCTLPPTPTLFSHELHLFSFVCNRTVYKGVFHVPC